MIDWTKRVMWTPPDFERPAAGEWDGDPNAMPGGWNGKWTVVVPDPAKSEQKSKSGEWIPFAKAIRVEDYRVRDKPTPKKPAAKKQEEKKPVAEKNETKASQAEKTKKKFSESASPCRFLDFDPDCLEKKESARGPYGIRDLRSGMWLAYSGGRWFRTESDAERMVFGSREDAADALCALEQRLWNSELASLRPAVEKVA